MSEAVEAMRPLEGLGGRSDEKPELVVTIPGDPVPWAPKTMLKKAGRGFIPARQQGYVGRIIDVIDRQRDELEPFEPKVPLLVSATFFVRRPVGHFGTGRNEAVLKPRFHTARPVGRPDLANLLKMIEDGLVLGGLIPDDDQIVGYYGQIGKWYTRGFGEQPRAIVRVKPL